MKITLDEFLPTKRGALDEFLPASPKVELPSEVLSPPELVVLHWRRDTCTCGRVYESQEHGPTVRHTISRRIGFGLRPIGKVYIPLVPGFDVSDVPQEIRTTVGSIFACPECLGSRPSLDLFPEASPTYLVRSNGDAMTPAMARWQEMHKTSPHHEVEATLRDMHKRGVEPEDMLVFQTTKIDLQSFLQPTCDPESQIEAS